MIGKIGQVFNTVDGDLSSVSRDFFIAIGLGEIENHTPVYINGYNPTVGSSKETVMPSSVAGRYPFPASAVTLDIVSNDADDTVAGTGAQTVTVTGLDTNYAEISETVDMDGTTPVTTIALFLRVNDFRVTTAGTTGSNEGNITLKSGATFLGQINFDSGLGEGISQTAVYTVPAGKELLLCSLFMSTVGGNNTHIHSAARAFGGAWITERHFTLKDSAFGQIWTYGRLLAAKTDLELLAHAAPSAEVDGGMCGFLRPTGG
jgi:hypothetical protein